MKNTILTLCLLALSTPALAEATANTFPVQTPDPPAPKTRTIHFSLLDQGISEISRSLMLRMSYRELFAIDAAKQQGIVFSAHVDHLMNTHAALLNRHVQAEDAGFYPNQSELGVGVGYRFAYENFALIPQAGLRDQFAIGNNVNQHLIGFEPGVRMEYWLYPEVARLSVDYGFNVPILHLANQSSDISPFTLSNHRVYTELSYRLFENFDVLAGFHLWQVPSQLGSGGITDTTQTILSGFQVGAGFAF